MTIYYLLTFLGGLMAVFARVARSYMDYLKLENEYSTHKLQFAYDGLRVVI